MEIKLMKCGCRPNATCNGEPYCIIHECSEIMEINDELLKGRVAKCSWCKRECASSITLPFFKYTPQKEKDEYYCGCGGWD